MKTARAKKAILMSIIGFAQMSQTVYCAAFAEDTKPSDKYTLNASNPALADSESELKDKKYDPKGLHRLDFHVVNKTCGVCLLNIQRHTRAVPAVVNAAVEIRRPFCVSVIYDSTQITRKKLIDKIKSFEKGLQIDLVQDEAIAKPPIALIPPHLGEPAETTTSTAAGAH